MRLFALHDLKYGSARHNSDVAEELVDQTMDFVLSDEVSGAEVSIAVIHVGGICVRI